MIIDDTLIPPASGSVSVGHSDRYFLSLSDPTPDEGEAIESLGTRVQKRDPYCEINYLCHGFAKDKHSGSRILHMYFTTKHKVGSILKGVLSACLVWF